MIPLIGMMIAPYIVVRMLDLATTLPGQQPNKVTRSLAVLTALWAMFCALMLVFQSWDVQRLLTAPTLPPVR